MLTLTKNLINCFKKVWSKKFWSNIKINVNSAYLNIGEYRKDVCLKIFNS